MTKFGLNTRIKLLGGTVRFNMDGNRLGQFERRMKAFQRAAGNMQPAFDEYGRYLVTRSIPFNFQREGYGRKWEPLNSAYAERKRRAVGNKPMLVYSGELERGFRWKATPRTLQVFNRVKVNGLSLFQIHQEGTEHIPARPMVFIGTAQQRQFTEIVQAHLYRKGR